MRRPAIRISPLVGAFGVLNAPAVEMSQMGQEIGDSASTFGAGGQLAIEVDIWDPIYVKTGYRIRWFSTSYTGGDGGEGTVSSSDVVHGFLGWIGFRI